MLYVFLECKAAGRQRLIVFLVITLLVSIRNAICLRHTNSMDKHREIKKNPTSELLR